MATPRQPARRPTISTSSLHRRSPQPKEMAGRNSAVEGEAVADGSVLQPGDEDAKRELERQVLFQNEANEALNLPNGYSQVGVLIIRWDETIDDFTGHAPEIKRLENIFRFKFGYECKIAKIKNSKKPQIDLNLAILQHVQEFDGPNNLLIVYYTGHGTRVSDEDGQHLELSATQGWMPRRGTHSPTALWHEAEQPLRDHAEGDVLSILDCCFASSAASKGRSEDFRTYQLLAASSAETTTSGPGENSFTTALSDSLEELLEDSKGGKFPVTKLWERINFKRTTQASLVWDRLQRYKRSVQLAPLDPERKEPFQTGDSERASLTLRFSLKVEDLRNEQIEGLARQLSHACDEAEVPIRRIDWVKMEVAKQNNVGFFEAAKAIKTVQNAIIRRKSSFRRFGKALQTNISPSRKRVRSDSPVGSHPRRQMDESMSIVDGLLSSGSITPVSSLSAGTAGEGLLSPSE